MFLVLKGCNGLSSQRFQSIIGGGLLSMKQGLQFVIPKVRYSEGSVNPKVRYSEGSLIRRFVIPKVHYSEGHGHSEGSLIRK